MDWSEYLNKILLRDKELYSLHFGLSEIPNSNDTVHPILSLSLELTKNLINKELKHIVIVLPDRGITGFIFTLLKSFHDIISGTMGLNYNPEDFSTGQVLKYKNCVVAFDRIEEHGGRKCIWVKCAKNSIYAVPIELAPNFQRTDTKMPLTPLERLSKVVSEEINFKLNNSYSDSIQFLQDIMTHVDNSNIYISAVNQTMDRINTITINGFDIGRLLLIGRITPNGSLEITNKGKLSGVPSIAIATNLHSVSEYIKKSSKINSIIIDSTNLKIINDDLQILDEDILHKDIPVIVMTDAVSLIDLNYLEERGFVIWRWNEDVITNDIIGGHAGIFKGFDKKAYNCANRKVSYKYCKSADIDNIIDILIDYKHEVLENSPELQDVYFKLFSVAYSLTKNISVFSHNLPSSIEETLEKSKSILEIEKKYVDESLYKSLNDVITIIFGICGKKTGLSPKAENLKRLFESIRGESVTIVLPDKSDIEVVRQYWTSINNVNELLFYTVEQYNSIELISDITIVCGWLGEKNMRSILYGYKSVKYFILLYDCENRWQKAHTSQWDKFLNDSNKHELAIKAFGPRVYSTNLLDSTAEVSDTSDLNIPEEMELSLKNFRYQRYRVIENGNSGELFEAIPVDFAGGMFALYSPSRKLVSITKIIYGIDMRIHNIQASEISIGDFIAVREADRDIIRVLADVILQNSGEKDARNIALRWREALKMEHVFSSVEDIHEKLKEAGCNKELFTVRQWIMNDDYIMPQEKDDLLYIAVATEDNNLLDIIDKVYEAGRTVKRAHLKAGMNLSEQLRLKIPEKLKELGEVDPQNIRDEIIIKLNDVGTVKVLKVVDKGEIIMVKANELNGYHRD